MKPLDALTKGAQEIIVAEDFERIISSGTKLRVKLGIDPTAPDLHLGHTVVLRKLRQFQDAGHQAVLIIGDFTATIGDPSGKAGSREPLTKEQVEKNLERFLEQAGKILDLAKLEVRHNSEWLAHMKPEDLLALHARFTLQQLSERQDFAQRIAAESPVGMHELDYPMFQAYDSVVVKADIELGGIDQKLNLIAGRHLMAKMGIRPQQIMMMPLLLGIDGTRKMSKSLGNYIGLDDAPNDMFGKLMAIPDALMPNYFELLTDVPVPTLRQAQGKRDAKLLLAKIIVGIYHGAAAGESAEKNFIAVFSEKKKPGALPTLSVTSYQLSAVALLLAAGVKSKSEARRLMGQGGVHLDDTPLTDPDALLTLHEGAVLAIGKRKFFKITLS